MNNMTSWKEAKNKKDIYEGLLGRKKVKAFFHTKTNIGIVDRDIFFILQGRNSLTNRRLNEFMRTLSGGEESFEDVIEREMQRWNPYSSYLEVQNNYKNFLIELEKGQIHLSNKTFSYFKNNRNNPEFNDNDVKDANTCTNLVISEIVMRIACFDKNFRAMKENKETKAKKYIEDINNWYRTNNNPVKKAQRSLNTNNEEKQEDMLLTNETRKDKNIREARERIDILYRVLKNLILGNNSPEVQLDLTKVIDEMEKKFEELSKKNS